MSEPLNSPSEALRESVAEPVAEVIASPEEEPMVESPFMIAPLHYVFETRVLTPLVFICPLLQDADGQGSSDAQLEEPKLEVCDMPCQKQLAVDSVEMSVESSLSGPVVPEVTIEG